MLCLRKQHQRLHISQVASWNSEVRKKDLQVFSLAWRKSSFLWEAEEKIWSQADCRWKRPPFLLVVPFLVGPRDIQTFGTGGLEPLPRGELSPKKMLGLTWSFFSRPEVPCHWGWAMTGPADLKNYKIIRKSLRYEKKTTTKPTKY